MNVVAFHPQNARVLPKVRSNAIIEGVRGMPCQMRISSFIGLECASASTVIAAHISTEDGNPETGPSDHAVCACCQHCFDLYSGRDERWQYLEKHRAAAVLARVISGAFATQQRLIAMGRIVIPDGDLI